MEIEAAASGTHGGGGGGGGVGGERSVGRGYGGGSGCTSGSAKGAYLVWEDLSVVLPNFGDGPTKRLLNGLKGFAEPGRIMAIMGPSGSGKSTLLDALAGSLSLSSYNSSEDQGPFFTFFC